MVAAGAFGNRPTESILEYKVVRARSWTPLAQLTPVADH